MAIKDIEWKKFMIQKGERVALGVAGFLAFLLIAFNLKSFFNAGPANHAKLLDAKTTKLKTELVSNTPKRDDDKPKDAKAALRGFKFGVITDPSEFQVAELFPVAPPVDSNRRQPRLFIPIEGKVAFLTAQLRSYILRENEKTHELEIKVRVGDPTAPAVPAVATPRQPSFNGFGPGRRGGAPGLGAFAGRGNYLGDTSTRFFTDVNADIKTQFLAVDKLDTVDPTTWLQTIRPVRMAIIAASFPYKREIEEFQAKLRKSSIAEVLEEPSLEEAQDDDMATPQKLEAFRFLGVDVERRTVDQQRKPLYPTAGQNGYLPLDVAGAIRPLLILSNSQTEPENPDLDDVLMDGLVMPRLMSAREVQYPAIEQELPSIQKTLKKLKDEREKGAFVPQVKNFNADKFDPFKKQPNAANPGNGANPTPTPMPRRNGGRNLGTPGGPRLGGPGTGPRVGGPGNPTTTEKVTVPDDCLIRVIDVTVKPGESYQYRIRVRMANPNYQRTDVVNPLDAENKELKPNPDELWYEIPGFVTVPSEMHYYAVDQKDIDKDGYRGAYANEKVNRDQTVLQIHKFLENAAAGRQGVSVPVGEWSVAERVIVTRGEVIDRVLRVEVPIFVEEEGKWKIASTSSGDAGRARNPGIDVRFFSMPLASGVQNQAILVDFDGGNGARQKYRRASGDEVTETPGQEVMMLSPEGKLLVHYAGVDAKDKDREEMLKTWRDRLETLRKGLSADPKDPTKNLGGPGVDAFGRPIIPNKAGKGS